MRKLSKRNKDLLFMAGFLAYLGLLYVDSGKLSAASRAFPMAIITFSVIVLVLKLLAFKIPLLRFLDPDGKKKEAAASEDGGIEADSIAENSNDDSKPFPDAVTICLILLWLATFPVGIYLLGFLPTLLVWTFIFMIGLSRIKVLKALCLSGGTFAILYVLFVVLLKMNFTLGILLDF